MKNKYIKVKYLEVGDHVFIDEQMLRVEAIQKSEKLWQLEVSDSKSERGFPTEFIFYPKEKLILLNQNI
ncbi:MAG: hypothetical protein OXB92_17380 [Acidimicrobiaceae bacterium]|nr:hypothetical protein [Acidimicrobiaceae bacterium]